MGVGGVDVDVDGGSVGVDVVIVVCAVGVVGGDTGDAGVGGGGFDCVRGLRWSD